MPRLTPGERAHSLKTKQTMFTNYPVPKTIPVLVSLNHNTKSTGPLTAPGWSFQSITQCPDHNSSLSTKDNPLANQARPQSVPKTEPLLLTPQSQNFLLLEHLLGQSKQIVWKFCKIRILQTNPKKSDNYPITVSYLGSSQPKRKSK